MTATDIFGRNISRAMNYLESYMAVCETGSSKTFVMWQIHHIDSCHSVGGNFTLADMFGLTTKIFLNKYSNGGPHAVQQLKNCQKPNFVLGALSVCTHVKIWILSFYKFISIVWCCCVFSKPTIIAVTVF